MATYDASVRKALTASQQDLIDHGSIARPTPRSSQRSGVPSDIRFGSSATTLSTRSTRSPSPPGEPGQHRSHGRYWPQAARREQRIHRHARFAGAASHLQRRRGREPTASSSSGWRMTARIRGSSPSRPTGETSSATPTNRPSALRRDSRPRRSARGGARVSSGAEAPLIAGTSPRPRFTRRVSRASTRSSLGVSPMRSLFMASTTPKIPHRRRRARLAEAGNQDGHQRRDRRLGHTGAHRAPGRGIRRRQPAEHRQPAHRRRSERHPDRAEPPRPLDHWQDIADAVAKVYDPKLGLLHPDPIRSAAHRSMFAHLSGPFTGGAVETHSSSTQPARRVSIGGHACRCYSSRPG